MMSFTINKSAFEFHQNAHSVYMDICEPLQTLGLKDHYYFKCLPSGEYLLHLSNLDLTSDQFMNIHHIGELCTNQIETCSNKNAVFFGGDVGRFDLKKNELIHLVWRHNFWNHVIIFRKSPNSYIESWGFSLGKDHDDSFNFFLKRMDLLERFISYFDNTAQDITQIDDHNKYAVFNQTFQLYKTSEDEKFAQETFDFLRRTSLERIVFELNQKKSHLTKREGQCLYFLLKNYTAKEIAQTLDISPRTVETFLSKAKGKLGKFSKFELTNFVKGRDLEKSLELLL